MQTGIATSSIRLITASANDCVSQSNPTIGVLALAHIAINVTVAEFSTRCGAGLPTKVACARPIARPTPFMCRDRGVSAAKASTLIFRVAKRVKF
jgi:hypothetical protein